jgi:hypothetical protein
MKRASIAVAVLVALTLTGCAGTPENSPDEPEQANTTAAEQTPEPSAAPATVEPTDPAEPDAETWFLEWSLVAQLDLPDADKLAAGYYACEQVEAGNLEVVAVEGLDADMNEGFVAGATGYLCPDLEEVYQAYRDSLVG